MSPTGAGFLSYRFVRYNITDERDIKDAIIKAHAYVEALPKPKGKF